MHSNDLAANVDPITRQYIGLVIQEALIPSLNELWESLERTRAAITKAPDTVAIESKLEAAISDRIASAMSDLVQRNVTSIRDELTTAIADLKADIASNTKADADLRKIIDALDLKIKKWADTDRYTVTRAQVMKAMREQKR